MVVILDSPTLRIPVLTVPVVVVLLESLAVVVAVAVEDAALPRLVLEMILAEDLVLVLPHVEVAVALAKAMSPLQEDLAVVTLAVETLVVEVSHPTVPQAPAPPHLALVAALLPPL